jgi:hypothetical protein
MLGPQDAKQDRKQVDVDRILVFAECTEIQRPTFPVFVLAGSGDGVRVIRDRRFVDVEAWRVLGNLIKIREQKKCDDAN